MIVAGVSSSSARRAGRHGRGDQEYRDRQHVHQNPAHCVWRKGALGLSRGGWTVKIHALTDVVGPFYALMLTPGNVSDIKAPPALLEGSERCGTCSATNLS